MKLTPNFSIYTSVVLAVLLLSLVSCSSDDATKKSDDFISIPDQNFESILIEQGIDTDGIVNQQLLKSDAEAISTLDLSFSGGYGEINNMSGIEGFINLKKLIATQQDFETIDLSKNSKLDTVYLAGNYLSTLDVSNNTHLVLLDVQSNNLKSITGLSGAKNLKELDVSWNYLETLTIPNTSLEVLHARNNDLVTLDIQAAIHLKNILLTTNQLRTLDVSKNILIETLLIPDNKIEELDLVNNIHLKHVYLFSNALTNLDVSANENLIDLKVDRNPELKCIKILENQLIPYLSKSDYQELNSVCN